MKTTRYKLIEKDKKLIVKIGFYEREVLLNPIILENGDIFYKFEKAPERHINKLGRTLEEIINVADCSLIFPFYQSNYPKIGKDLNHICDGKLLMARYTDGLDVYYNSLQNIINSKDLAIELLEHITNSIYGIDTDIGTQKAYRLIKKYEQEKNKIN